MTNPSYKAIAGAWNKANKKRYNATQKVKNSRRRAVQVQAEGSYTLDEWLTLVESCGHKCLACGNKRKLTADHIVPLSRGGTNFIDNIQPLCGSCNSSKRTRTIKYEITRKN
jgi:5-methylcytosine-specific restriction endonuclease McrA